MLPGGLLREALPDPMQGLALSRLLRLLVAVAFLLQSLQNNCTSTDLQFPHVLHSSNFHIMVGRFVLAW